MSCHVISSEFAAVLEIEEINPDYRKFASRWVLFNESDGSGNVDYMGDMFTVVMIPALMLDRCEFACSLYDAGYLL